MQDKKIVINLNQQLFKPLIVLLLASSTAIRPSV